MAEIKDSKLRKMIKSGSLAEQFTQNGWFVKLKPALGIDKVCFSFVKKGSGGKESFDIYMAAERFTLWCEDIQSRAMLKIINDEKAAGEKYPKTYKYITGNNGDKTVGICPSTSATGFATINGSITRDGKKLYANIPVDYWWLREMARRYFLLIQSWEEALTKNLSDSMNRAEDFHRGYAEDEEEYISDSASMIEEEVPPVNTSSSPKPASEKEVVEIEVKTNGEVQTVKGNGWSKLEVLVNNSSEPSILFFKPEGIESLGKENWDYIVSKSKEKAIKIKIKAEKNGNNYLFVERIK